MQDGVRFMKFSGHSGESLDEMEKLCYTCKWVRNTGYYNALHSRPDRFEGGKSLSDQILIFPDMPQAVS